MRDLDLCCAGPHYRLVRRMRSGHSEVIRRYRILSSPLDLHVPRMRACANACVRACMRARSAVGVVRREASCRLYSRVAAMCLPSRTTRSGKSKGQTEKVGTSGYVAAGRTATRTLFTTLFPKNPPCTPVARAVAIWSHGRVTR